MMTNLCDPRPLFELFVEMFVVLPRTPVSPLFKPCSSMTPCAQRPREATQRLVLRKRKEKREEKKRKEGVKFCRLGSQPGQGVGDDRDEGLYAQVVMMDDDGEKEIKPHLRVVQLEFSDNFNGAFTASLSLDSLVDVRECTITHLLD